MRMRSFLLMLPAAALGILGPATPASAQSWFRAERSFSLAEENDAFASSDSSYTQGLRATWDFSVWNTTRGSFWTRSFMWTSLLALDRRSRDRLAPVRACTARIARAQRPCGTVTVGIGQTEYTPSDLLIRELQADDRPYAGYLFAGLTRTALYARAQVSSEVQVGVSGPAAIARQTQSLAHWTWSSGSPQPQGWHHQLDNALHLSVINQYSYRPAFLEFCVRRPCSGTYRERRLCDATPRAELIAGTLMNRASLGGVVRAGYGFPDVTGMQRIAITRPPQGRIVSASAGEKWMPWIVGFATFDQRFVGSNALITGSYADRGPGEWQERRRIDLDRAFGERAYGVAAGLRRITIGWQRVTRGAEYALGGGSHRFSSISLSVHAPQIASGDPDP